MDFYKNLDKMTTEAIKRQTERKVAGVIKSYNSSTRTVTIYADEFTYTNISVQGSYRPSINDTAILVLGNGYRYVLPATSGNYLGAENDNIYSLFYNLQHTYLGNHIINGNDINALKVTSYSDSIQTFYINKGSFNILGSIYSFSSNQTFIHTFASDGIYYLFLDNLLSFKIKSNISITTSELLLCKITKTGTTYVIEDLRKTTAL